MADLLSFKVDNALPLTIKHPQTGEDLDMIFHVHSASSKHGRNVIAQAHRDKKQGDKVELTEEEFFSHLITEWSGVFEGDQEIECTPENIERILTTHSWILWQLQVHNSTAAYAPKS